MISMLSMSSGLMSFNRPATWIDWPPKLAPPPDTELGPVPVALFTRTPSTYSSGLLSSDRLERPRTWIVGPAPRRDVVGAITTPGARAASRLPRFGAADFSSSSEALIVDTALPIERRVSPPAVD